MKSTPISLINVLIILLVILEFCESQDIELTQNKAPVNSVKNVEVYVNGKKVEPGTNAKVPVNPKAKRNSRARPRRRSMRRSLSLARTRSSRRGYPNRVRGRGINNVNRNNINVNVKVVIKNGKTQIPDGYTNGVSVSGGYFGSSGVYPNAAPQVVNTTPSLKLKNLEQTN